MGQFVLNSYKKGTGDIDVASVGHLKNVTPSSHASRFKSDFLSSLY